MMHLQRPCRCQRGFTLLELVVVVAVIGTVAFLTVPRLRLPGQTDDLEAAARWIMTQHHKLRIEAVRQQHRYRLHCDLDAQRLWVSHDGMDETGRAEASEEAFRLQGGARLDLVRLADGREFRTGQKALVYFPDGHSYLAQILLREGSGRHLAVRVEAFLPEARLFDADRPFLVSSS